MNANEDDFIYVGGSTFVVAEIFNFFQFLFATIKKVVYICTRNNEIRIAIIRAISSAGSEHLVYTEGVGGSNPSSPTKNFNRNVGVFFHLQVNNLFYFT